MWKKNLANAVSKSGDEMTIVLLYGNMTNFFHGHHLRLSSVAAVHFEQFIKDSRTSCSTNSMQPGLACAQMH